MFKKFLNEAFDFNKLVSNTAQVHKQILQQTAKNMKTDLFISTCGINQYLMDNYSYNFPKLKSTTVEFTGKIYQALEKIAGYATIDKIEKQLLTNNWKYLNAEHIKAWYVYTYMHKGDVRTAFTNFINNHSVSTPKQYIDDKIKKFIKSFNQLDKETFNDYQKYFQMHDKCYLGEPTPFVYNAEDVSYLKAFYISPNKDLMCLIFYEDTPYNQNAKDYGYRLIITYTGENINYNSIRTNDNQSNIDVSKILNILKKDGLKISNDYTSIYKNGILALNMNYDSKISTLRGKAYIPNNIKKILNDIIGKWYKVAPSYNNLGDIINEEDVKYAHAYVNPEQTILFELYQLYTSKRGVNSKGICNIILLETAKSLYNKPNKSTAKKYIEELTANIEKIADCIPQEELEKIKGTDDYLIKLIALFKDLYII